MKPKIYFDTFGEVVAKHAVELLKLEMTTNASAATGFWQVHDFAPEYNVAVPPNGSVPLKSWPAAGGGGQDYKEFKGGELCLSNGLYVCFSTTDATLTLGTVNNKFSTLQVELVADDPYADATAVEDGGVPGMEVWADADGPKRLIRAKVKNLEAAVRYLQLYSYAAADGAVPLKHKEWTLAATGDPDGLDSVDLRFADGLRVYDVSSAGVRRDGCWLIVSENSGGLQAVVGAGANFYAEHLP